MTSLQLAASVVNVQFDGFGYYVMTDGDGVMDLGACASEEEVRHWVMVAVQAGTGEESWAGWRAVRVGVRHG